ncbi:MAG: threonine synthase [Oscillospiraceae bacterium]|nr:threonine synthase [Oscillospiraceae bacterium]
MNYFSTRGGEAVSSAKAIVEGLAPDGGLYTMAAEAIPHMDIDALKELDYYALAAKIVSALLPDFSEAEAHELVKLAYSGKFSSPLLAPVADTGEDMFLELFRGPTSAFKDMALCLLPYLMKESARKCGQDDDILILTATSGDTGKAAMEGFRDVPGIKIIVFYPDSGVSAVQKQQMVSQEGKNVKVCAVIGNFDDAQSGVKRIFESAPQVPGVSLSSANSINIGRLVPQVVYYFSAYFAAVRYGRIKMGEKLNFSVPTGNFGDILAGYIADCMGLPVGRLICASNENNVLTDFINTGVYDRRRDFHKTISPSMDILISSNLERLLYLMSGDSELVASLMSQLKAEGHYQVPAELLEKIQAKFSAYCCDDAQTKESIRAVWDKQHYLCDTHTAVAWKAAQDFGRDKGPCVILSTASPYKFPAAVMEALGLDCAGDEYDMMEKLEQISAVPMPENLRGLKERKVLHNDLLAPEAMPDYVFGKMKEAKW